MSNGHPGPGLVGRRAECERLNRLLDGVRAGQSRVLVLRGEPGVGKTALMEYLVEQASGCRVARATGVQSEMELAFAGLHQVCAPMLDHLKRLPVPQRDALRTAFGLSSGSAPDRFMVALAVLSLLSDVAEEQPLVCLVDDEQWLDRASAQALGFVARRLGAEPVGLVFAARASSEDVAGLPELVVEGLPEGDARLLLDSVLSGPMDERVRDQIIAETRGNPLALLELPRGLTPEELAGGFGVLSAPGLPGRIEQSFLRRYQALPPVARLLLLVAAAEPTGDPVLVWRAAGRLGIGPAGRTGRGRRRRPRSRSARSTRRWACWSRRRRDCWMNGSGPGPTCCAARSRSCPVAAWMLPRFCSRRPASSNPSTRRWLVRPIWKRCPRRCSRDVWASAAGRGRWPRPCAGHRHR